MSAEDFSKKASEAAGKAGDAVKDGAAKAGEFVKENAEKVQEALKSEQAEGISDKILDGVADLANKVTGGKHADKIEEARSAADKQIGNE